MIDSVTPEKRSEIMGRVRSKNTRPEMIVRRLVHGMGYRYRLHSKKLPGHPDLVFARRKAVIFVHGCFWHRHDCPSGQRTPKSRLDFWLPKLKANKRRDLENQEKLIGLGWRVLVIWECEVKDSGALSSRIKNFLEGGT